MTDADPVSATESNHPGPSEVLVRARERLGYSQKDIADKLFLTPSIIRLIDEGEFERMPKAAFVRGYLRSYARLVELSADEIVALYEAELEAAEPAPEIRGVTEEQVGTSSITGPVLQTGIFGLIGLIIIVLLVWWLVSDDEDPAGPVVTQPGITEQAPDAGFEYVLPPAKISGETAGQEAELVAAFQDEVTVDELSDAGQAVPDPAADDRPATSAEPAEDISFNRVVDGNRSFITVDANGPDQVEMRFVGECWVEISDAQLGQVYEDLNRGGDVLTLYGTAPFEVLLGKATEVEMIYNGRPFELSPYIAPDRTAKLIISE